MNKLRVKLDHCFGIRHMEHEFNFEHGNVIAIYAKNGLMKTSFAKTMKKLQMEKSDEIRDEIFSVEGSASVIADGQGIEPKRIFVINSFESAYQADITPLLINETIKAHLQDVLKARDKLFKALEKSSELKIKKTVSGKTVYELENAIIHDFEFSENSFLVNVSSLQGRVPENDFSAIPYARIFDDAVIKKILSTDFQTKIRDYIARSDEIYASYSFLSKGYLTLPKLKNVQKSLKNESYFSQGNTIILSGKEAISSIDNLSQQISEIEGQLKSVPEFQAIEKLLSDAKGTSLRDIIEINPEIVGWLTTDRLPELKKCLWLSYLQKNTALFGDLCAKYAELSREIDSVEIDDTPWKKAIEIYDKRFSVPYKMEIANLKGAIIGESIPKIEFSFTDGDQTVRMTRDKLDELNTLSQGEKRALYLLNIIFEVEEIKQAHEETLFIVDDIADSFDYKNKYAIVEYLYEIAQDDKYSMIILSHNFDFYRTISSRLGLHRKNRLCAGSDQNGVVLAEEHYQKQPFEQWKEHPNKKNVIAMIPFVRNLVEYGKDQKICSGDDEATAVDNDFNLLTMLLHEKAETANMRFSDLKGIYKAYLGIDDFEHDIEANKHIIETLYEICDSLTSDNTELEDKILLAMAIRHKAEEFMKNELRTYTGQLSWRQASRTKQMGTSNQFLLAVDSKSNQTRELLNGYKQFGTEPIIAILESVAIMTPENIHLNSFMYEPIMDMDILELTALYEQVKELSGGTTNG